jgi:tRNA(fMet)-specific endonuclease VapC
MYVLDSNCLIHYFKRQGRVVENFLDIAPQDISIPAVALYELETGVAKSRFPEKSRAQLDEVVSKITVLPFGFPEAKASAQIRANLEAQGKLIGPIDILIAGTVLRHGATLVTHNTREFGRVEGLSLVDWY